VTEALPDRVARGPRRYAGLRHSAASTRAGRHEGNLRSLAVAFAANVVVATAKLAAGVFTGSSALLAEAAHSVADSTNEVMLAVSFRRARRDADTAHPFGYGGVRFVWAFLAAISSFLIGGCLSVGLAIHERVHGGAVDHYLAAWIVLAVAAVADGAALAQTLAQARREAARWGRSTWDFLRHTSEPTLRALAVEDTAALVGVALAAGGHQVGGPAGSDAIASLLIGILLGATAIGLARPLADLLIGRSIQPDRLRRVQETIAQSPAVDEVLDVYAIHLAPQDVLVAAKVHPVADQSGEQLAGLLDDLDVHLRSELPEVGEVFIDVTAHRRPAPAPGA
jgi:cation diffusion facilitator family transporter